MPCNWPALKGRDEPFEAAATFRGGQRLVISPLQGLLPENEGVSFATLLARPFRARSSRLSNFCLPSCVAGTGNWPKTRTTGLGFHPFLSPTPRPVAVTPVPHQRENGLRDR